MNTKQIKAMQTVTKQNWVEWKGRTVVGGSLAWSIDQVGDNIYAFASNVDSKEWFDKLICVTMLIGPQGGIKKFKVIDPSR